MGGRLRISAAIALALGFAGAGGCGARRPVPHDPQREMLPPLLAGGETEAEVRALYGPPDRTLAGDPTRAIWYYDRYLSATGARSTMRVTFAEGRVRGIETYEVPREERGMWPGAPDLPKDSAAKRDMMP